MTSVSNADSLLAGKTYTMYALKYINTWAGNYLRRGKDVVVGKTGHATLTKTNVRHNQFVESDPLVALTTKALLKTEFPVIFKDENNQNITCKLLLTFDDSGNCTITNGDNTFTATGTGKFVKKGEKKSWGDKDRDALYLNYQIDMADRNVTTTDTLVMRDRGVTMETFTPVAK
jgi:hypothetical protein